MAYCKTKIKMNELYDQDEFIKEILMEVKEMGRTQKYSEITESKKEMLANMPNIETKTFKSKDGKWVIHKTIITEIKPVTYLKKVLEGKAKDCF
jgi:hypothetical protein